jgi:Zn-dependent protease with chaperone function
LEGVMAHELAHVKNRDILISTITATFAGALRKLHTASQAIPMMDARPATPHMFIVNPLTGGGMMALFSTHPPMEERISRLEALAARTH